MSQGTDGQSVLWEENVPLMQQGVHKELVKRAYEGSEKSSRVYPLQGKCFCGDATDQS